MKIRITLLWLLLFSHFTFATPIVVSSQQLISSSGQLFHFSFSGLPKEGANGQFNIILNGDFSDANSESSIINLDVALGLLDLGNGNLPNGIIRNTIAGLTLNTYSRQVFESNDIEHSWVFNISDSLLSTLLMDGTLGVVVKNDVGVDPLVRRNPDFVRVGYSFQTINRVVTEASSLWLFMLGFGALFTLRFWVPFFAARRRSPDDSLI
jgi:hypothetical protein